VYGAVVCSYDAVSLFYLELYVKLSIYLSIYVQLNETRLERSQPAEIVNFRKVLDRSSVQRCKTHLVDGLRHYSYIAAYIRLFVVALRSLHEICCCMPESTVSY
jgi:hypothetical protein